MNANGERLLMGLTLEDRWLAVFAAVIVTLLLLEVSFPELDYWLYWRLR